MLVLFIDWCENITSMSEGLGFHSIFALSIFYGLKHFLHYRIKGLKTIYCKSKLRLKARIWVESWKNCLRKILQIGAIDPELK